MFRFLLIDQFYYEALHAALLGSAGRLPVHGALHGPDENQSHELEPKVV